MNAAVPLSAALVEQKARSIFGQRRHRFAALLDGTGTAGSVTLEDLEVEIVATTCELDLRRQMAAREGRDNATLYLVDWHEGEALPRDLRARVAEGKIYRIGRDERLRQVFHANRLSYDLTLSSLARLALAGELRPFPPSPKLTLDLRLAALTWLEQTVGPPFRAASPREEDLLEACAQADPTACQQHARASSDWRAWLAAVPDIIHAAVSPLAAVAFCAWRAGQLDLLSAVLWTLEAQQQADASAVERKLVRAVLLRHIPDWTDATLGLSITTDGGTVDAWDRLLRGSPDQLPTQLPKGLAEFEAGLDSPAMFAASCRHPAGRAAREDRFARALQHALQHRSAAAPDAWLEIRDAAASLSAHRQTPQQAREPLDMSRRLVAWLCSSHGAADGDKATHNAIPLAARFAKEGGFVDWARRVTSSFRPDGELGRALETLRDAVEQKRDREEQAFAQGIQAWAASGRSATGCIPIERASKALVADFLRGAPEGNPRRLLVLLMDGMSWARCQELCEDLREDWAPLRWRPSGSKSGDMPPMLAALPTLTSVSRSAFFAGKLPPSGPEPATSRDPDRWANNPAIHDFDGPRGLPLYLKAAVEADRQLPATEVLEAIGDRDQPLVAAVVNTLDDQLKGSASLEFTAKAGSIKPLRLMLEKAEQAGRAVLLVADHGHVLTERTERLDHRQDEGGARWRTHADDQPLRDHEVLFETGAWSPQSGQGVVLLTGEQTRYSKHAHHGEHGGLSLSEVVSPAVLLGQKALFEDTLDPGLDHAPPQTPTWWAEFRPEAPPSGHKKSAPSKPTKQQTPSLFGDLGEVETASGPPRPGRSSIVPTWVKQLKGSPTFKSAVQLAPIPPKDVDRSVEQAIAACRLLVESGGRASARQLAQKTDVALTRIDGLMSRVKSIVNAEGEMCLRKDNASEGYMLDIPRFELVFGVQTNQQ